MKYETSSLGDDKIMVNTKIWLEVRITDGQIRRCGIPLCASTGVLACPPRGQEESFLASFLPWKNRSRYLFGDSMQISFGPLTTSTSLWCPFC